MPVSMKGWFLSTQPLVVVLSTNMGGAGASRRLPVTVIFGSGSVRTTYPFRQ
jgi:hypothetical protein